MKRTLKEQLEKKRQAIRDRQARFDRMFAAAPQVVQSEFHRCTQLITQSLDGRPKYKLLDRLEVTIYGPDRGLLTETQLVQLQELLRLEGWDIDVTAPLEWKGPGPRPLGLRFVYRHDD